MCDTKRFSFNIAFRATKSVNALELLNVISNKVLIILNFVTVKYNKKRLHNSSLNNSIKEGLDFSSQSIVSNSCIRNLQ